MNPRSSLSNALTTVRQRRARAAISPTARQVIDERLTYLTPVKMRQLEWAIKKTAGVRGSVIETGVALGGSAVLLAGTGREFDGYDVFDMIPPPGKDDAPEVHTRYERILSGKAGGIGGDPYAGFSGDFFQRVVATFARYDVPISERVRLHKGFFEDTLHPSGAVSLAHIDCDWYDPVKLSLERIYPHLSSGGLLVMDDYHYYSGAAKATDEVLARFADLAVVADRESVVIQRA